DWSGFLGGDARTQWSDATQVNSENAGALSIAWVTPIVGSLNAVPLRASGSPHLHDGRLIALDPFGTVLALDPRDGRILWSQAVGPDEPSSFPEGRVGRGVVTAYNPSIAQSH